MGDAVKTGMYRRAKPRGFADLYFDCVWYWSLDNRIGEATHVTLKPVFQEGIFTLRNLRSMGAAAIIELAIALGVAAILLWQQLRPIAVPPPRPISDPISIHDQQPPPLPRATQVPEQQPPQAPQLSEVPAVPVAVPTPNTLPMLPLSPPPVPNTGRSAPSDVVAEFEAGMKRAIDSAKVYPKEPLIKGVTGTATVSFDYVGGVVSNIRVDHSSGDRRLDEAAMQAVQNATLPPKPAELAGTGHFVILVDFSLDD